MEQLNIIEVGAWGWAEGQGLQEEGAELKGRVLWGRRGRPQRPPPHVLAGLGAITERPGGSFTLCPDVPEYQEGLQTAPKEGLDPAPPMESERRNLQIPDQKKDVHLVPSPSAFAEENKMEGGDAKAIQAEVSGGRPAGASWGPQCPIKLSWQSACVRFGGSLHGAQAPSPPPAVGGQSCLHWGWSQGRAGLFMLWSPHSSRPTLPKVETAPLGTEGPLGSLDQLPGRRSSVHTALPDLGFSTLGSGVNVGFSRRQSGTRGVDFQWLVNSKIKHTEPPAHLGRTQL